MHTDNRRAEIVSEVALQYRFPATNDWAFRNGGSNHDWSEPTFTCGGKSLGKRGAVFTDARKSAATDGLTQAASMIGVGHQVFKGLVRVESDEAARRWEARQYAYWCTWMNAYVFSATRSHSLSTVRQWPN